tara:strand:+ start:1441 stop:1644 length:204 start_codon:yes stop_codon:yes gene_type:complete
MNVRVGECVEALYKMSLRGEVIKVFYVPVTAETGPGTFSKRMMITFIHEKDGTEHTMRAQDLRKVRE